MQYQPIGNSGIMASKIILGTWAIGGFQWGGTDEQESLRAIHAALDAGINAIDTAPIYGFGESEVRVGKALAGRRDRVVLATKCGIVWHVDKGKYLYSADHMGNTADGSGRRVYRYLHPQSIRYEIEHSLSRLKTDYIDLYQVHGMDEITPVSEIMGVLSDLRDEGKIRAIGLSNVSLEVINQFRNLGQIDADQERYSLFDREVESKNIHYCIENGMAFLAYSPLFHGLLTGKINKESDFRQGDFRNTRLRFAAPYIKEVNKMLLKLDPIALNHKATTTQLILAYMLHQPGCTHALVGARRTDHARENAMAAALHLSSADINAMNQIFMNHLPPL